LLLNLGLYNHPLGYILLKANPGILMLLMVGYYKTIPREFDEAAAMDGCGSLRYIARFILPLSKPVFATAAILFSLGVWNDIIGTTIFLTSPRYYPVIRSLFAYVGQYGITGRLWLMRCHWRAAHRVFVFSSGSSSAASCRVG
jgi:raffinose/stachyose/melibiose transport system permease protein